MLRSPVGTEVIRFLSKRWSRILPPIKVGLFEDGSYCNSKNRPALDAVGVVTDLVVVRVSNTKAANDSFVESGVEEYDKREDRRCERMVVFPDPVSPLYHPLVR